MVALFHVLFKFLAIFFYLFGSYFTSNYILIFVFCILMLAFDFWTVKNVSGRLLVGLRWWSLTNEDGSTDFHYESLHDMTEISPMDSRIFWWGMYASMGAWCFFLFIGALRLNFTYIPLVLVAISMTGANLWGYMKCSADADQKLRKFQQGMSAVAAKTFDNSSLIMNFISSSLMGSTPPTQNASTRQAVV